MVPYSKKDALRSASMVYGAQSVSMDSILLMPMYSAHSLAMMEQVSIYEFNVIFPFIF